MEAEMEDRVEKIAINYDLIAGTRRASNCTFCGRSQAVSDYAAGRYVVQFCDSCAENPPGVVKAEVVEVVEAAETVGEKSETKKKKK